MIRHSLIAACAALLLLTACSSDETKPTASIAPQDNSAVAAPLTPARGRVASKQATSQTVQTTSKNDLAEKTKAESRAYTAPIGQQITWNNQQTGNYGTITPLRDGYTATGAYCRDFLRVEVVGGQQQQNQVKLCQQPNGTWKSTQ